MVNILIVDDREDNRTAYKLYLDDAGLGWNVLAAKDEIEAIKVINREQIDVIITDLVMLNEKSGINVLSAAKQKDPLAMVILVTAFDSLLDRYSAFELGAFDCIQKNVPGLRTGQELLVKTKNALQFRQLAISQLEDQKKMLFLKRYFDPRVFKTILDNPNLLNIHTQTVSVAFWDIRGFSALSEILKANPTLISNFLRDYFTAASQIVFQNGGVLDKFIGDGVLGLFGALNGKNDNGKHDAQCAVKAAVDLKKRFSNLLETWTKQWTLYTPQTIDIGLGCGIHTGEVLIGNVGTEMRDQFTALGPQVNLASRISSQAEKNQILISVTTNARVYNEFKTEKIACLENIKNITGKYDVFEVIC